MPVSSRRPVWKAETAAIYPTSMPLIGLWRLRGNEAQFTDFGLS
jgi:hypothetical protein